MLEKYESKQVQIRRDPASIYGVLSDFNNFTPMVADRVEGWNVSADGSECSFRVKGVTVGLRMVEKVSPTLIKIEAADASPFGFTLWVQLKEAAPYDTRLRLVLHAEMNMMIKMMVGSKLQGGLDQLADTLATAFNAA
jgi:carbon monoxide dehydrogenase subunit G